MPGDIRKMAEGEPWSNIKCCLCVIYMQGGGIRKMAEGELWSDIKSCLCVIYRSQV